MTIDSDIALIRALIKDLEQMDDEIWVDARVRVIAALGRVLDIAESCDGTCGIVSPCTVCGEYPADEEELPTSSV